MPQKAVIFDFDGTIADSFSLIIKIAHQLTHRSELVTPEEVVRLRKLRLLDVVRELEIPKWQAPLLLIRGRRIMAKRMDEVLLFGGMTEAIKDLHEQGYKLYIVSTNSTSNVKRFLHIHGLATNFHKIYGNVGLLGKAKVLKRVVKANHLDPASCLYVGDEPRDIEASHLAGLRCIGVSWGFNTAQLLHDHQPLAVVNTPEELVKVINGA